MVDCFCQRHAGKTSKADVVKAVQSPFTLKIAPWLYGIPKKIISPVTNVMENQILKEKKVR